MKRMLLIRAWCSVLLAVLSLGAGAWAQGSGAANPSANNPDRGVTSEQQTPGNASKAAPADTHSADQAAALPGPPNKQTPDKAQPPKTAPSAISQDTSVHEYEEQTPSLGDVARQTRKARLSKAQATAGAVEGPSTAPAGFQSFTVQYCMNPDQCSEASLLIPENAEVLSRTNGQHIFKTSLNGDPVMLYAGPADVNAPYRSLSDADYIRMRNLANPFAASREKADALSAQAVNIEGRSATVTRFRYQREQDTSWLGERTLIEMPDGQFMLVCTALEQHFSDAEALCKSFADSLRLP